MQDISARTQASTHTHTHTQRERERERDYYYFKFILTYQLLGGGLLVSPESQQQIKAVYPSTLQLMCAVLISVIFCSTMADGDLGATKGSELIPS